MFVQALQNTYVQNVFRRGPELDLNDEEIDGGEVFEVPDDYDFNPNVLQVVERKPDGTWQPTGARNDNYEKGEDGYWRLVAGGKAKGKAKATAGA